MSTIADLQKRIHQVNRDNGWWNEPRNLYELIALMHSELSEAVEYLRHGNGPSDHIPTVSGCEEELADCVIRIMDFCEAHNWDLEKLIELKLAFNAQRGFKHGGKEA